MLKKNGSVTAAPPNSMGCKHCSMIDMKALSASDVIHHTIKSADKFLADAVCSHTGCKNGTIGKHWPIDHTMKNNTQGYWCKFALDGLCQTLFCVDCGKLQLERSKK